MLSLKVTQVGNSLGVILPKELIAQLKVDKGDLLFVTQSEAGVTLTPYDPTFEEQMNAASEIMKRRRLVLRELAK